MQLCEISIHALLAESDFEAGRAGMQAALFLSTLSLRRATGRFAKRGGKAVFLSTLSLRRATGPLMFRVQPRKISIHALLAESDRKGSRRCVLSGISIHALLAESDLSMGLDGRFKLFLSTLSLRRATDKRCKFSWDNGISIHALLAESDANQTSMPG